jgi:hypothetical protein
VSLLLVFLLAASTEVPRDAAERAAREFCRLHFESGGFSVWDFSGRTRAEISPLLTERLIRALDNGRDCGRDWSRQQPAGSTDKPPFVDCCLFTASNDWFPSSFEILSSEALPDGRRIVSIQYRYESPQEHGAWQVAVIVAREHGRYLIDDFVGDLDEPFSEPFFLSSGFAECQDGRWMESRIPQDEPPWQPDRLELYVGRGVGNRTPNIRVTVKPGVVIVTRSATPILPGGKLTKASKSFPLSDSARTTLFRLADQIRDFDAGCRSASTGISTSLVILEGDARVEHTCRNALNWPTGASARRFVLELNKSLPKEWRVH